MLEPTYGALIEGVRASRAVAPDETGWRINGQKAWLWAFAGEDVTVYLIAFGRGYVHATEVLGEDYSGCLSVTAGHPTGGSRPPGIKRVLPICSAGRAS